MLTYLDAYMEDGGDLGAGVEAAMALVRERGLAGELFDEVGAELIRNLWTARNRARRTPPVAEERKPAAPSTTTGWRDPAQLDPMDALYPLDGGKRYTRLGDLLAEDCKALATEYHRRADGNRRQALAFEELAARLCGTNKTVREALTEAEVSQLLAT